MEAMNTEQPKDGLELVRCTTSIVSAFLARNETSSASLPDVIRNVHTTLKGLAVVGPEAREQAPAVNVADSVHEDYLICLEDGKKLKLLKRYLHTQFNMTPEQYREKWGLPPDYPMACRAYSVRRSKMAKEHRLGKQP